MNIVATYIVCHTYFEVKNRKRNQIIFIWLVPILGSALAIYLNREDHFHKIRNNQIGNDPNITDSQASVMGVAADHQDGR